VPTAIILALVTAAATSIGALVALRTRDRLHLILGLSAGLLLGLVGFDLLPTVFSSNHHMVLGVRQVAVAIVMGFFILHLVERTFATHEPHESEYEAGHTHTHVAGSLSAIAMIGHVFLDGVGIGVAFRVSNSLGLAVFVALVVHAFSDGLNTVMFLIQRGRFAKRVRIFVLVDALARVGGAALGSSLVISASLVALYLALFTGFVIYIATSHILPEAHAQHPSRWTLAATLIGILIMWLVVASGA